MQAVHANTHHTSTSDDMVAGIAAAVDELGIANNTFIMFTSDHGTHSGSGANR